MSFDDYAIARLSADDRDSLAIFDCYNQNEYNAIERRAKKRIKRITKEMNTFLDKEALDEQDEGYNTTFVLRNQNNELLAYLSLCTDAIKLSFSERDNGTIGYETFPALKIARLAVHKDHQKCGIGAFLINYAVFKALMLRQETCGVKFITLDCFVHRLSYYENIGFVKNQIQTHEETKKPISMRLHIDDYNEGHGVPQNMKIKA